MSRNPLGIIVLFITLIYVMAGFALSNSSLQPGERLPLIWFLVIFPFTALSVFAWLVSRGIDPAPNVSVFRRRKA